MPTESDTHYDPSLGNKFIFVTGGVMSGLGKGITAASTGRLLKNAGFDVTAVKIDPYLNVDAGTMNPTSTGRSTSWRTVGRSTSIWGTTNGSSIST